MSLDLQKIDWTKPIEHWNYKTPAKLLGDTFEVSTLGRQFRYGIECERGDGTKFCLLLDENGTTPGGGNPIRNTPLPPVTRTRFVNVYATRECLHQTAEEAIELKCGDAIAVAVPVEIVYQP